jgi:hypothetical protein
VCDKTTRKYEGKPHIEVVGHVGGDLLL